MSEPIARTLPGQLIARLREKILAGEYAPGAALLQDSIAAEYGVSKIPVREALLGLKAEGLVDIFAHRGFQVRRVSAAEADEVFSLRLAIEPDGVAAGAKLADDLDRERARAALLRLHAALGTKDLRHSADLNTAFHLSLLVPHLQPVTSDVLTRLHGVAQRYVRMHLKPTGRSRRAIQEHKKLFDAWAEGRVRDAREATRAHIEETRAELVDALAHAARRADAGSARR